MGNLVATLRTPTSASQVASIMTSLWPSIMGGAPNAQSLAVLATQIDVETGWTNCWNYNVGNIVPSGGSDYIVVSGITLRAFTSFEDGITAFLSLLKGRYSAALASAALGDLSGYAANLKAQGYYGADESAYLAALQSRYPKDAAAIGVPYVPSTPVATNSASGASTWLYAILGGLAIGGAAFLVHEELPRTLRAVRRPARGRRAAYA
jgi:hypothetical protein